MINILYRVQLQKDLNPSISCTGRNQSIDSLRGFAVVLMMLDHFFVVFAPDFGPGRLTITRLAMPIFVVLFAALQADRFGSGRVHVVQHKRYERLLQLLVAGTLCSVIGLFLGMGQPDILLYFAAGYLVFPWLRLWAIPLAIIQPFTWPVQGMGYQPGAIYALMAIGAAMSSQYLEMANAFRPGRGLSWLGRNALSVYVGHFVILLLLACAVHGPARLKATAENALHGNSRVSRHN